VDSLKLLLLLCTDQGAPEETTPGSAVLSQTIRVRLLLAEVAEGDLDGVSRRIRHERLVHLEGLGEDASLGNDGTIGVFLLISVESVSSRLKRAEQERTYSGVGDEVSLDAACSMRSRSVMYFKGDSEEAYLGAEWFAGNAKGQGWCRGCWRRISGRISLLGVDAHLHLSSPNETAGLGARVPEVDLGLCCRCVWLSATFRHVERSPEATYHTRSLLLDALYESQALENLQCPAIESVGLSCD
jgi:hypothetical protein